MAKAKLLTGAKTVGLRFKPLMSFEWPKRRLPKDMAGILVAGLDKLEIKEEGWFTVDKLNQLVKKGYIQMLPKKKKKKKAKAAR